MSIVGFRLNCAALIVERPSSARAPVAVQKQWALSESDRLGRMGVEVLVGVGAMTRCPG